MDGSFMVDFFAGAVTLAFLLAGVNFYRFWRKTGDGLFLGFGVAFWLLATNTTLATILADHDEETTPAYVLRVLAFLIILYSIARKNALVNRDKKPR